MEDKLLTISQAARRIGIHINTLRAWTDAGRVPVFRTPTNQRRYRQSDIDEIAKPRMEPAPLKGDQEDKDGI